MTTQTPDAVREAVTVILTDWLGDAIFVDSFVENGHRQTEERAVTDDMGGVVDAILAALDSRAGDAGEVDQTKADYCPGYCARGEPHNGPHDPIVLNRQSGGQTAEVLNATPAPAVDAVPAGEVRDCTGGDHADQH